MSTIDETRRANLALIVRDEGGVGKVALRLNRNQSQVSQWLHASPDAKTGKPRAISSASARMIEKAFRLPIGWLDIPQLNLEPPPAPCVNDHQGDYRPGPGSLTAALATLADIAQQSDPAVREDATRLILRYIWRESPGADSKLLGAIEHLLKPGPH